jgi:PAS domain S-box-containing protein
LQKQISRPKKTSRIPAGGRPAANGWDGTPDVSLRILILTPTGNDSLNACLVLAQAGLDAKVCANLTEVSRGIVEGAGAVLIAEEAFTSTETDCLVQALSQQAPWSDIPMVLITAGEDLTQANLRALNIFAPAGNVTLLERPLRPVTLVSSLQVALRSRRRQYQMRNLLAEQQLVLASIQEAFVTIDHDWNYTYVSDHAAEIAGLSREEMLGRNCWELFGDTMKEFRDGLERAMRERIPLTIEHHYARHNQWYESRIFPAPIGISIFTREITHRKLEEEALKQARDELEDRVEERTAQLKETISELEAFSYSVSHDLRGPLRAMQGYSEFLLEDCAAQLDDNGKEYVRRIIDSAARLDHLVQDILTYGRVARAELEIKPIDLEKVIRDVIQSYPVLQERDAEIEIVSPMPKVQGHEGSLVQTISNLLTNAVKFIAEDRAPQVKIWTEKRRDRVRVWFQDNGIGVAAEHQERIFKMFEKAPNYRVYEGTGIGLAIVRKAVERMGGKAGVESTAGQGSRFWIELLPAK